MADNARYERRSWMLSSGRWRWEIRDAGTTYIIASGSAGSSRDAVGKSLDAVEAYERETRAKWKPVFD